MAPAINPKHRALDKDVFSFSAIFRILGRRLATTAYPAKPLQERGQPCPRDVASGMTRADKAVRAPVGNGCALAPRPRQTGHFSLSPRLRGESRREGTNSLALGRLITFAIGLAALSVSAAAPPAQKLLPQETVLVVSVPDAGKALAVLTNSTLGRIWRDPAVNAFRDRFVGKFQSSFVGPLERQLGISLGDYAGLAQGQITFAIVPVNQPDKPDEHYTPVFLLDAGDRAAQLSTNLAAVKQKWIAAGKSLKTEKIRETEFTTFLMDPDDLSFQKLLPNLTDTNDTVILPRPPAGKLEMTFGQSGSLLVVSRSTQIIEKILARQSGGLVPGLDEEPAFQKDFAARLQGTPVYIWFNAKALLGDFLKQQAQGPGGDSLLASAMNGDGAMAALGFTSLTSASVTCRDTPEGLNLQVYIGAPEADRRGLAKVLETEPKDSSPPSFVPADAVRFSRVRLDIPRSWRTLDAALTKVNPQFTQFFNYALSIAGKAKDENYDLRGELMAALGDDIISYERSPTGNSIADSREAPGITLIGSPAPAKLAAALKVALSVMVPADKITDRDFLGRKIYTAPLPLSLGGGSRTYHFAANSGYLAVTSDVDMLEEFLRSNDSEKPGLIQTPGLADAAQKAGGGMSAGIFKYNNDKESMRALFETLRAESVSGPDLLGLVGLVPRQNKISTVEEANQFKEWCDFSLLPPTAALTKYFNYTVWSGGFNQDGFTLNCYTPKPPAQ